jgi:hypothetical protein
MVGSKLHLDSILRELVVLDHHTGIVDQDVDSIYQALDLGYCGAD